jgi:hypothetical protein
MFRFLGGVCGIAISAAVFAVVGSFDSTYAFTAGFSAAVAVCAGLSLAGAAAGILQPDNPARVLAQAKAGR